MFSIVAQNATHRPMRDLAQAPKTTGTTSCMREWDCMEQENGTPDQDYRQEISIGRARTNNTGRRTFPFYGEAGPPPPGQVREHKAANPQLHWDGNIPAATRIFLRRRGRLTHDDSLRRTCRGGRSSLDNTPSGLCLQITTSQSSVPH